MRRTAQLLACAAFAWIAAGSAAWLPAAAERSADAPTKKLATVDAHAVAPPSSLLGGSLQPGERHRRARPARARAQDNRHAKSPRRKTEEPISVSRSPQGMPDPAFHPDRWLEALEGLDKDLAEAIKRNTHQAIALAGQGGEEAMRAFARLFKQMTSIPAITPVVTPHLGQHQVIQSPGLYLTPEGRLKRVVER